MKRQTHWIGHALGLTAALTGCGDSAGGGVSADAGAPPVIGSGGGFVVGTDGFSFANYGNREMRANLTAVELRRMFGDRVCGSMANGACALTPPTEQFMTQINKAIGGGHCEGMAVLSQMFHAGRRNPMDFGAATVNALTIDGNEPLQREIAYWWTFQAVAPTATSRMVMAPAQLVAALRQSFMPNSNQAYTIALFKRGKTGGHAVTPVSIRDVSTGRADIVIYDNNFPNAERAIEVDTDANTWRYTASTNPMETASVYEGDAASGTLMLVPLATRLATHDCAFCGNYVPPAMTPMPMAAPMMSPMPTSEPRREVQLSGDGDAQIRDAMNREIGMEGGAMMNNLPGASAIPLTSVDPWSVSLEPLYFVPAGTPLAITVDGSQMGAASPTDVTITGLGYSLAVRNIQLNPGQRDTINVSPVGAGIRYSTTQPESADIVVAVQNDGADYRFTVRTHGGTGGEAIAAALDAQHGVLVFDFEGTAGSMNTFDLEVERVDASGVATFAHMGAAGESGASLRLHYATWAGDGTPMVLGVDANNDGTDDMILPLSDM